jgi:hypothetical protein
MMFPQWVNAHRSPTDLLRLIYLPRQIDQFWYLYALFNVTLLYTMTQIRLFSRNGAQLIMGLAFYFLGAFLETRLVSLGFLQDVLHYYLFFVLGCISSKYLLNRDHFYKLASWNFLLASILFFLLIQAGYFFFEPSQDGTYFIYFISHQPIYFLLMASGALLLLAVSFSLEKKQFVPILKKLGEYSLYIYIWHVFFMAGSRILLINFFHFHNIHLLIFCGMISGIVFPLSIFLLARNAGFYWLYRASRQDSRTGIKKTIQWLNA